MHLKSFDIFEPPHFKFQPAVWNLSYNPEYEQMKFNTPLSKLITSLFHQASHQQWWKNQVWLRFLIWCSSWFQQRLLFVKCHCRVKSRFSILKKRDWSLKLASCTMWIWDILQYCAFHQNEKKKKKIIHIKECFKTPQIKLEKINRVLVFEYLWQIICF